MNDYLNNVALDTFSLFDAGTRPAERELERFYHGFVLGCSSSCGDATS